jgi:hypothetical protein
MKIQKKIAMTFGGAVLAACVTVGGLAAANAATPAPTATPTVSPTTTTATATPTPTPLVTTSAAAGDPADAPTAVPVPALPDHPYNWDDFIKTLTPAQQQALLVDQEAKLAHYKDLGVGPVVEKLTYNVGALKKALGQ